MYDINYLEEILYLCGTIIICIVALIASPLIITVGAIYFTWNKVEKRMWK